MITARGFTIAHREILDDPYERLCNAYDRLREVQATDLGLDHNLSEAIDRAEEILRPILLDAATTLPYTPIADAAAILDSAICCRPDVDGAFAVAIVSADLKFAYAGLAAKHREFITGNLRAALRDLAALTTSADDPRTEIPELLARLNATRRAIVAVAESDCRHAGPHLAIALANGRAIDDMVAHSHPKNRAALGVAAGRLAEAVENASWAAKFLEGSTQSVALQQGRPNKVEGTATVCSEQIARRGDASIDWPTAK